MSKTISQSAFARSKGVTPQYIGKLIREGKLTKTGKSLDLDVAERQYKSIKSNKPQYNRYTSKTQSQDSPPDNPDITAPIDDGEYINYKEEVTIESLQGQEMGDIMKLKESYKALNEKLKYDMAMRTLVPAEEIYKEFESILMACRSKLLALPTKLTMTVEAMETKQEIHNALETGIGECLRELTSIDIN